MATRIFPAAIFRPLLTLLVALFILAPQMSAAQRAQIVGVLERYSPFGFQGAVLVGKRGKRLFDGAVGGRNEAGDEPVSSETLFEIASLTKQFTAAAILLLEQDGKLKVEDLIHHHLPNVPEHSHWISIHHLLTHTAEIPRTQADGRGDDLARAVEDCLGDGPVRPPGAKWEYWNGGYALRAGIVEQTSGQSFQDFCRERLFLPAKMADSGFTGDKHLDATRAAWGEGRTALEHPYGQYGWQYKGMGGAVTTVQDLFAWDRALAKRKILDKDATRKLFQAHVEGEAYGADYGYGWFLARRPRSTPPSIHGASPASALPSSSASSRTHQFNS